MINYYKLITLFTKGALIGVGAIIPGVSGGTVAIILNIFEEILDATANFNKHFFKSVKILFPIFVGIIVGILLASYPINYFCIHFPVLSKYFFSAIVILSCIIFAKSNLSFEFDKYKVLFFIIGIIIAFAFSFAISSYNFIIDSNNHIYLFFIGLLLSLALVLPAISFSYMLLFFGIYETTLNAITEFNLIYLFPMALGIIVGTFIFSKMFLFLINKHKQNTYALILGFVIFSIAEILIK